MRSALKKVAALTAVLLLTACATVPGSAPAFSEAPAPTGGEGLLYVYRVGAYPTLRTPKILVDGKPLFAPPERAYTWAHLPAGEHKITVNWAWDTGWPDLHFKVDVAAGQPTFLKISGSFENLGDHYLAGSNASGVDAPMAMEELKACCKYIPPYDGFR
jgi:hypothetical protein